jgi:hypothetical protein
MKALSKYIKALNKLPAKDALNLVERDGKAVSSFLSLAETKRAERGALLVDNRRVQILEEDLDSIFAVVFPSLPPGDGLTLLPPYRVHIELRRGFVLGACTCADNNRNGPCKHVVATGLLWLEETARPTWSLLNRTVKARKAG